MSGIENDDRLIVTCPCGFEMEVSAADMGRTGECTRCGESITVTQENTRPLSSPGGSPKGDQRTGTEPVSTVIRSGRYPEAVERLKAALSQDDSKLEVWYALAYCQYKMGDYDEAQVIARRAEQLGHPSARDLRKRILVRLTEQTEGVRQWEEAQNQADQEVPGLPGPR